MLNYEDSYSRLKKLEQEKKLMQFINDKKKAKASPTSKESLSQNRMKMIKIRENLIEYRKTKAKEKNIPPCYIFTNDELDKILATNPKTYSDLSGAMILPDIKLKLHGEEILNCFKID